MKTIKFLSMAALALVGAVMTGCSSDDDIIDTPQQPANNGKTVTLTMSVGLNSGGETRALAANGTKTFAAGEKMAVIYKNNNGETAVAETEALVGHGDITNNGKSAYFTVTLVDPNKGEPVMYIYPAAMAKASIATDATIDEANTVDYTNLDAQDGTLGTLESSLDLATFSDLWENGTSLPAGTLVNKLAVCALTLKNSDGSSPITSGLTQVTVSDGTNTYTVAPTSGTFGEAIIYVAIRPVTAALEYTATDGTTNYTKTATSREYAAGNFYNLGLRMVEPVPAVAEGHALSASVVGEIVCSDGLAYAAADKDNLPQDVTAVAMIAYVGTASDCTTGLAIALEDVSSSRYTNAAGAVSTWASGKTAPAGCSWRLPSIKDWQYMLIGCEGSGSYSDPSVGMSKSYSGLASKLTAAGGTALGYDFYWSSTEFMTGKYAWRLFLDGGDARFAYDDERETMGVRACLAF